MILAAVLLGLSNAAGRVAGDADAPCHDVTPPDRPAGVGVLDALRSALDQLAARGIRPPPETLKIEWMRGLVRAADSGGECLNSDAYAVYAKARRGVEWGIGARFVQTNGHTWVSEVFEGGPAAGSLQVGDRVLEIAGRFVTDIPLDIQDEWARATTGSVSMVVSRGSGVKPVAFSIEPGEVQLPAVESEETLPGGIRLIAIRGFWPDAGGRIAQVWADAAREGGRGVILDLRQAGGDCPQSAVEAAAAGIASESAVVEFESVLDGRRTPLGVPRGGPAVVGPTMLLIGPGTTGAAEVFAAALKASGREVMTLGQPSAGDPCIRDTMDTGHGIWLRLAVRRLIAGGRPADVPLEPHLFVREGQGNGAALRSTRSTERVAMNPRRRALEDEATDEALLLRVGDDAVLERAVDMLRALRVVNP